jgi:hypothetical protein
MNIFVLSYSAIPQVHYKENARMHCDKHVVKMITESVQMLVTVLPQYFSSYAALGLEPPCKPLAAGHAKHPCVLWLQQDLTHFNYLSQLAQSLCEEKQARWPLNADHEYQLFIWQLCQRLRLIHRTEYSLLPETFATAVKSVSLRSTNRPHVEAVTIYRDYYIRDKAAFATWRGVSKPDWWPL